MIAVIRNRIDAFLGRGRYSAAVPVMDGPLQPNQLLETATVEFGAPELDNLVSDGETFWCSSGASLMQRFTGQAAQVVTEMAHPISCLACGPGGSLAIGQDRQGIVIRGGRHDGSVIADLDGERFICPTAALFLDEDTLIVASGSARLAASDWKRDLMQQIATGSVWRITLRNGQAHRLSDRMLYPYGLARAASGAGIVVSEAWAHRLVALDTTSANKPRVLLDDLPGYPSRLIPASRGGYWLAVFAPRNQLLEFVLRERGYRDAMLEKVDPAFWIAPSLSSRASFKEPLQYGGVKHMGILKPWAPSWSYGLVVRLDGELQPYASWHSRADGARHGITSVAELEGRVLAGSKGAGLALRIDEADRGLE